MTCWRSQSADRGKGGADHGAGDSDLGQMEGDGGGMTQHAGTDPDQFGLEARQRPIGHGLGQFNDFETSWF